MNKIFDRILGRDNRSATHAKERLKLVLIHDRTDMSPATLEILKDELIAVISRYVDIDPVAVHIDVAQDGREQRLVADIPLRSARRRRVR
jgi:cell division topological specificity factor